MVDITLFHQIPGGNYHMADRLNSRTGRFACYFLEWTGWYNHRIATRLLGHHRLFQLYKKDPDRIFRSMPLSQAYLLHYCSSHPVKYFISKLVSFIYSLGTLGRHYLAVEIETFNKSLIHEHAGILQTFLEEADHDFTAALHKAIQQLDPSAAGHPTHSKIPAPAYLIQFNQSNTHTHQYNTLTIHNPVKEASRGKQKDVFSKKQVLMLFDLLSSAAKLEAIDLSKPAKFEAIAAFLYAVTGKSKESWVEELNDYKTKDLYAFHTRGELQQLISTLSNLAEFLRKAGFRSVATLADKKIRELERHRKDS